MKKIFSIGVALLFSLSLLLVVGCEKKDAADIEINTIDIELSSESITLGKMDTAAEVTVDTSAKDWSAFFSQEVAWAKIKKTENKILITAEPNLDPQARKTTIVVMAGQVMKKISLTQSSADAIISVEDSEVSAPLSGGLLTVEVKSNTSNWSLEPLPDDCKWLTAKADRKAGIIYLQVEPNETTTPREVLLGVKMEDANQTLKVKVSQKSRLSYPIPFAENLRVFDVGAIIKHGVHNGYILGFYSPSEETWLGETDHVIFFLTGLKDTPSITYTRSAKHPLAYEKAEVPIPNKEELLEGGGYRKFLEENGFKLRPGTKSEEIKLENEDGSLWLNLKEVKNKYDSSKVEGYIAEFVPQFIQDRPYETFIDLPLGATNFIDMLNSSKYHVDDVMSLESSLGSSLLKKYLCGDLDPTQYYYKNPNEILHLFYMSKKGDADKYLEDCRWTEYYTTFVDAYKQHNPAPELIQSMYALRLCFFNYSLGVYMIDDKSYKVTKEFNNLLISNGFTYLGITNEGIAYVRKSDNLQLMVQMLLGQQATDIFKDKDKVLMLKYTRPESSVKAAMEKDDRLFYEAAMRGEYVERHHLRDVMNSTNRLVPSKKLINN